MTDTTQMIRESRRRARRLALPLALSLLALALGACSGGNVEAAAQQGEELARREASVTAREAELAARAAEIDRREQRLGELAADLDLRQQDLAARDQDLGRRASRLAGGEADLRERRSALEQTATSLADREQSLALGRAELERRTTEIAAAREEAERQQREAARSRPRAVWTEAEVAAGTLFDVELLSTVSSGASRVGERFRARLNGDLKAADGSVAASAGTELVGTVIEAVPLKKVGGQARLALSFDQLVLPSGQTVEIDASFYGENREGRRDAATIGSAAVGGAILGRIIDRDDKGRATLLGAILGAAAGTAVAAGGEEVEIPAGAVLTLRLDAPAAVLVPWRSRYDD